MTPRACALFFASALSFGPAAYAEPIISNALTGDVLADGSCPNGFCQIVLSPTQMLARTSQLVANRRFAEAKPLVAALGQAPGMAMEAHFLAGYIAVESGDLKTAINEFRASLAIDPKQTRVRLELARAMMLAGKDGGADYNFRLAEQDGALPDEIRATILHSRGILRDRKPWHLSSTFGIAPDSNITNGTEAQTVDVVIGTQSYQFRLNADARARSGLGQTGSISAGYRFKAGDHAAILIDTDAQGVNYKGTAADDYTGQIAIGPEFRPGDDTSLSIQGVGLQRWYGGTRAVTQFGARLAAQHELDDGQRIGLTFDARHSASGFQRDYSGWNLALYATYERVIARSIIANVSLFARADRLNGLAYSNKEFGLSLGIGGELTHGVNAGISGTLSHAGYGAAMAAFSPDPRTDWRGSARFYAGLRSMRFLGFSPSVSYTYSRTASSLPLYASKRSRFAFDFARYF